jgi:cytochrome c55X
MNKESPQQRAARATVLSVISAASIFVAAATPTFTYAGSERADPPLTNDAIVNTWRILRMVDCARCHGKDYEGLAAPSIVGYARTQSREMFVRMVLDGDPPRGMPAYRDNPLIAGHIDDIYRYFVGRANGAIRAGAPLPQPQPLQQPQPK